MRKYRFWYHYNKPKSREYEQPIMTVHYKGHCIHTKRIVCDVPTETHRRSKQPYMVMRGWTTDISILDDPYVKHSADDDIALLGRCPVWPYEELQIL